MVFTNQRQKKKKISSDIIFSKKINCFLLIFLHKNIIISFILVNFYQELSEKQLFLLRFQAKISRKTRKTSLKKQII